METRYFNEGSKNLAPILKIVKEEKEDEKADILKDCFNTWCKNVIIKVLTLRGANPDCYKSLKIEL